MLRAQSQEPSAEEQLAVRPHRDRLVELQRIVGNCAMAGVFRNGATVTPLASRQLQRCGDGRCACSPRAPAAVREVLRLPGRPLDSATRTSMEARFGQDFAGIRVHADRRAAESAEAVHALAYTVGRDIVFASGQYSPGTAAGRRVLAHELAHAVQQRKAPSLRELPPVSPAGGPAEREAEAVAAIADRAEAPMRIRERTAEPTLARQLHPGLCSADCYAPDGTGTSTGKYELTVYADKEGPFLLLPLTDKVGHSWVKLVDDAGRFWTYGFWPQSSLGPSDINKDVAGCVHHPDVAHSPTASQTFELTAAEFAAAKAKATALCSSSPNYNLFGLQCTSFAGQILEAAGKSPSLGFGLIWESPNALHSWIRSNSLLIGASLTAATSALGGAGAGSVGLDVTYVNTFYSALGNKLRLQWLARGELSTRMASLTAGAGVEVTSQRVFLPRAYVFGGGIAGELTPGPLGGPGEKLGAGLTAGGGLRYSIDELATVGVEYNLVKDLVNSDPELHRLMLSAGFNF
jgi:Domain of unknown function (DUF4157)